MSICIYKYEHEKATSIHVKMMIQTVNINTNMNCYIITQGYEFASRVDLKCKLNHAL